MERSVLLEMLRRKDPLLADAVMHMTDYVTDRFPSAYPSHEQTEAVNAYLRSVRADGDGTMTKTNCEHRRIASQQITLSAVRLLDTAQLDRLQNVLDHIAYDRDYCLPEHRNGLHR